jgi:small subunit ribosomal protein S20
MPNTKSAKKRHRQGLERRAKNRAVKSSLKTGIKKLRELVSTKNADESKAALTSIYKALDQAAARGVIHVNKAARTKSRLSHLLAKTFKPASA